MFLLAYQFLLLDTKENQEAKKYSPIEELELKGNLLRSFGIHKSGKNLKV